MLQALEPRLHLSFGAATGFTFGRTGAQVDSLATDRAGNAYVLGTFSGVADFDPSKRSAVLDSQNGGGNGYFAKYSPTGKFAWVKQIPATATAAALAVSPDGDVFLTGVFSHVTDFNFDPLRRAKLYPSVRGWNDAFVARYNTDGRFLWVNRFATSKDEKVSAIAVDGTGTVHLAGLSGQYDDVFLAAFSARGKFLRSTDIEYVTLTDVAVDDTGNIYIAGNAYYSDTDLDPSPTAQHLAGGNENYLLKLDAQYRYGWSYTFDLIYADLEGIAADASGVCVVGDYTISPDFNPSRNKSLILPNDAGYHGFLAKYTPQGALAFARHVGGNGAEAFADIDHVALNPDGGDILVTGTFNESVDFFPEGGSFGLHSHAGYDMFFATYNGTGRFRAATSFGTRRDDESGPLVAASRNAAVLAGWLSQSLEYFPGAAALLLTVNPNIAYSNGFVGYLVYA